MTTKEVAPATLAEALERLQAKHENLNSVTQSFSEAIQAAEKSIARLKVGVSGFVTIETRDNDPLWLRQLRFEKYENEWRLILATGREDEDGWDEYMPLVNAPRSLRMSAIERLPELVINMVNGVDSEIAAVTQSIGGVQRFVESLDAQTAALAKREATGKVRTPNGKNEPQLFINVPAKGGGK